MPSLGADMESGKVVEWLVGPGSAVKKGDVVAVVETHKGAIEVEIFEEGVISELCADEGDEIPVGAPLARLERAGAPPAAVPEKDVKPSPAVEAETEAVTAKPPPPAPETPEPAVKPPEAEVQPAAAAAPVRARVTPAARRRAAELGIDPDALAGTGIDGSVTLADVEAAGPKATVRAAAGREPSKARQGFDPAQMRQAITAAMSRSKREIPHYYLASTIDMSPALEWLTDYNRARTPDERLLPTIPLLKAAALAVGEVPQLNGFWENDEFRPGAGIHIGWAISLRGGGLIAPAIRDVDRMSLPELMVAVRDVVSRARGGGLRSSELTDASFTVTSLGDRGADSVIGVIYPPQVAILGLGRIAERPWAVDGKLMVRPLVSASLAADHRASDGHTGGLFLSAIARLMQEPEKL